MVQTYPLAQVQALPASIVAVDPFADLAIVAAQGDVSGTPMVAPIVNSAGLVSVGAEIVVLGYPFGPIGSLLETWTPGYVTALARRAVGPGLAIDELVLSSVGHIGSSGSAVIGRANGMLYGIFRGSLAPPEALKIGEIPIATDTSVTFATSAHILHDLLVTARSVIGGAS